jgi:hypothetical protein
MTVHGELALNPQGRPYCVPDDPGRLVVFLAPSVVAIAGNRLELAGYASLRRGADGLLLERAMLARNNELELAGRRWPFFGYGDMWCMVSREFDPWLEMGFGPGPVITSGYLSRAFELDLPAGRLMVAGIDRCLEGSRVDFHADGGVRSCLLALPATLRTEGEVLPIQVPEGRRVNFNEAGLLVTTDT